MKREELLIFFMRAFPNGNRLEVLCNKSASFVIILNLWTDLETQKKARWTFLAFYFSSCRSKMISQLLRFLNFFCTHISCMTIDNVRTGSHSNY